MISSLDLPTIVQVINASREKPCLGIVLKLDLHEISKLTAMSPLQYQKTLRLSEARRLMLSERLDATTAAIQVGYESPSQFSREYRRLFGAPPKRDINRLHQVGAGG